MTLLFCLSNMFVPTVLTQVLENPDKQYIVYTDQQNIERLFLEFNIPNVILKRYLGFTQDKYVRIERKRILLDIKSFSIEDIYFYHTEYGGFANWIITKLAKGRNVYFASPFEKFPLKVSYSIKSIILRLREYLINGAVVTPLISGSRLFPSLSNHFYKTIHAQKIKININDNLISNFIGNKYSDLCNSRDIVLLIAGIADENVIIENYIAKQDEIITRLGFDSCVTKCHPRFNDKYGNELKLPEIPSYIPANLLLGNFSIFISYQSTVLAEAARAGKLAIATLYIHDRTDPSARNAIEKVLNMKVDGKGVIYYPKSIDELITIVSDYGK